MVLKISGINLNRKMLSEMAINDPQGFENLVNTAKKSFKCIIYKLKKHLDIS
jgi:LSU ribosomal protein L20P